MSSHSRTPQQQHRRSRTTRRLLAAGSVLVALGGAAAVPLFADAASTTTASTLTVAKDGSAKYTTVQAAVNAAKAGDTISIAKGTYKETVNVPTGKTGLSIIGATGNPEDVVITYGNASGTTKSDGSTYGTLGSATATFAAAGMTVENVTVTNSFSKVANPTVTNGQAVALAAEGDKQVYKNDRFIGHQDTLLAWSPSATAQTRQYFSSVFIKGDTDFIFGNATAVFDHANIQAIDEGAAAGGLNGFITAANTESSKTYGFLISNSTVSSSAAANTYYLGRPWHPTSTAVAQVVFRNTVLPAAVKKATPWTDMSGFAWTSARFHSYLNTGAGAATNADTPQLTAAQAANYTEQKYLAGTDGWNPTGTTTTSSTTAAAATAAATATKTATATSAAGGAATASAVSVGATGDTRTVTQPAVPTTVCATVSSTLAMSSRLSTTANETTPPDTARIQAALNSCTQSGSATVAVKLTAADSSHNAFLSGPLTVHKGEVLLLDSGVTLYGSRNPANYQISGKSTCGTLSSSNNGCYPLITVAGANAGVEAVRSSSGSQGRIDGRGDQTMLGSSTTWWGLATAAQSAGKNQNNPRLIQANSSDNFTLYDIDLLNAANFHVVYNGGNGFTAWGVRIKTPATARNTDGIDPAGATNVTIADSYIQDGDDGIAIKGGSAASSNITVKDDHFYGTHGISIGSETYSGVTNVLVENNTVTGTDSSGTASGSSTGLRIKSSAASGGKVSKVGYLNNCLTAVKAPLVFDTHYSSGTGSYTPYFTGIVINGLKSTSSVSGAKSTLVGLNAGYPLGLTLANVNLDTTSATSSYAAVGLYNSNLKPSGTGVSTSTVTAAGSVPSCTFPSYPTL